MSSYRFEVASKVLHEELVCHVEAVECAVYARLFGCAGTIVAHQLPAYFRTSAVVKNETVETWIDDSSDGTSIVIIGCLDTEKKMSVKT